MKRSPFKASQKPLQSRKRIRQVSPKKAAQRASSDGQAALAHMAWVKTLPCAICGKPGPSDAHHVFHDRGSARKVSDWFVIPLCKSHHQEGPDAIHTDKRGWRERHGPDWSYLSRYLPEGREYPSG